MTDFRRTFDGLFGLTAGVSTEMTDFFYSPFIYTYPPPYILPYIYILKFYFLEGSLGSKYVYIKGY